MYVCMYVCVRGEPNQPLHRDLQWSIVLPPSLVIVVGLLTKPGFAMGNGPGKDVYAQASHNEVLPGPRKYPRILDVVILYITTC
jgi:hypothetical protein